MAGKLRTGYTDADIVVNERSEIIHKSFGYSTATISSTETKITASDTTGRFGYSVAVGCGRIVIGAPEDDQTQTNSGAAYVFDLDGNEIIKLKASDLSSFDEFGFSVAVGNGRIVVGAPFGDAGGSGGAAYIFDLDGNELAKIRASDRASGDQFGFSVTIGCGRIVVGAPYNDDVEENSGSAYIFDLDGNEIKKITSNDAGVGKFFGWGVAVGNGTIVVGEPGFGNITGSIQLFDLDGNYLSTITPTGAVSGDEVGSSVAVGSGKIVTAAQGDDTKASNAGAGYVFDLNGDNQIKLIAAAGSIFEALQFVAVSSGRILLSSGNASAVYVFDLDGGAEIERITPSDDPGNFGDAIAMSSGKIVVGAFNDTGGGSAYIYDVPQTYDTYIETLLEY